MATGIGIVVFDWGGVILRICRSWAEGCERAGLDVREGSEHPDLSARRREIAHRYQIGAMDCDSFCRALSVATDGLYTPSEMRRIHDAWLIGEYPGVDELIDRVTGIPKVTTGMLSNTNHLHWIQQLHPSEGGTSRFPTARRLEHRHASHVIGVAKPEAGIYERFEASTGFAGSSILFFDDLAENIEAARSRGWNAEQIDHQGDTAQQMLRHLETYGVV
jgi:FMN phosphatase YigB (HAD superfamily)